MSDPIHFSSQLKELKGGEAEIVFTATIDPGWHVYSTDLGNDGPISATFHVVKMSLSGVLPLLIKVPEAKGSPASGFLADTEPS